MTIDWFEVVAAVFGALSVWLYAKRRSLAFPLGIVNVAMYVVVFYRARFYADMALQVVYIVLQAQGWYAWVHSAKGPDERIVVKRFEPYHWRWSAALFGVGALVLGGLMARYTDASLPWLDASTATLSLIAQLWLNRKYLENWLLWIGVDFVYLFQYTAKGLYITTALYAVFLVLAVDGYRSWARSAAPRASLPES